MRLCDPVAARACVSLHADTDFVAKVTDVFPGGDVSMLVQDSIVRMRWLNGGASPVLITPGQVYEVDIEIGYGAAAQGGAAVGRGPRGPACRTGWCCPAVFGAVCVPPGWVRRGFTSTPAARCTVSRCSASEARRGVPLVPATCA